MATVRFGTTEIECEEGTLLRDVLLAADQSPHNGGSNYINCNGHGTCGTCAVDIEGPVSDPTDRERRRMKLPPHSTDSGLRLACQTRVQGDITIRKHDGFWGQHVQTDEE